MNIALLYYSGAGNTKFIAHHICRKLEEKSYMVDMMNITNKSLSNSVKKFDLYIIGFPVYALVAPELVKETVRKLQASNKPVAFFCTKAFMSVNAIKELSSISNSLGFSTVATLDLFMPGTDLMAFAATKNSRAEKIIKSLHSRKIGEKIDKFIAKIEKNKEIYLRDKWYTNLSFLIPNKTKVSFYAQYSKQIPDFHCIDNLCITCMICVNTCPRENISFAEGIKFGSNCDVCLKCLHHCPAEAIQVGSATKGKSRYNKVEIKI